MGLLASMLAYAPTDDYWYNTVGNVSLTGIPVTTESAMKVSAFWACVRNISEPLSMVPLQTYERMPDGSRVKATGYYLYSVLHDTPNPWQTSMEWRQMMTTSALIKGNGYSLIVAGRAGFADRLVPIYPDRVRIEELDNRDLRYWVRQKDGTEKVYDDSQIFHLKGPSLDGIRGMSVLEYARESIGLAKATESYGSRFFSQNATPGGVIKHPGKLNPEGKKLLKESWQDAHSGLGNAHKITVLDEGMEFQAISLSNEDAQMLLTREHQVADIARYFNMPLHMIGETNKVTSWGSGIEQLGIGYVTYTLQPWATRWEQAIARDLIVSTAKYYVRHDFRALARGDMESRNRAYATGRQWGWLSANDVRELEEMNRIEEGDVYLQASNMTDSANPAPVQPALPSGKPDNAASDHYELLLHETAARIVRKETAALTKAARRCASDLEAWRQAIDEFYAEHADFVVQTLQISPQLAEMYVREQRALLLDHGVAALEDWETQRVNDLVGMIQGEKANG